MEDENKIIRIYGADEKLRNEYFNFILKVFPSADFTKWHNKGFWTDNYISYSILESGKIISNVSVSLMDVIVSNKAYKAIQLGAVGTIPEYRSRGLSRIIMEYVLNKYMKKVDLFFLFANKNVLEFYPKFGFKKLQEKIFSYDLKEVKSNYSARKLNLNTLADYNLLLNLINDRKVLTKIFGADNYGFITIWHIFNTYADNLHYLEEENCIVIKTESENVLNIREIICKQLFDFESVLTKVIESESITKINYYFPPDQIKFTYDNVVDYESYLFVRGKIEFDSIMPKFPETAHT